MSNRSRIRSGEKINRPSAISVGVIRSGIQNASNIDVRGLVEKCETTKADYDLVKKWMHKFSAYEFHDLVNDVAKYRIKNRMEHHYE